MTGSGPGCSERSSSNGVSTGWITVVGSMAGAVGAARAMSGMNRMAVSRPDSCSKSGGWGKESPGEWVFLTARFPGSHCRPRRTPHLSEQFPQENKTERKRL